MRIPYKSFPLRNRGVPEQTKIWRPILPVQIISSNHAKSNRFEAVVDTGSDYCLFNAMIGARIGIKIENGCEGDLGGVIGGPRSKVYYHNVKLVVAAEIIEIKTGFSFDLTENLLGQIGFFDNFLGQIGFFDNFLGQIGFFDNFTVTFDPSTHPPCFEIHRAYRH